MNSEVRRVFDVVVARIEGRREEKAFGYVADAFEDAATACAILNRVRPTPCWFSPHVVFDAECDLDMRRPYGLVLLHYADPNETEELVFPAESVPSADVDFGWVNRPRDCEHRCVFFMSQTQSRGRRTMQHAYGGVYDVRTNICYDMAAQARLLWTVQTGCEVPVPHMPRPLTLAAARAIVAGDQ